ncbi:HAD family hydrolase [Aestuariimicrobium sp. T2.26MG-19.2B]|uniref:HAD family hydrolase n=1 Tax=Aestuariimicrobium sp. T2.26MG-19.2B TaxID=3040679 RepID=UPI0024774C33|nr:HAD family hydrolase [Aestuariimicrobium sp. T2.26MG-19.2B]CAI9406594.1 Phosphoglycolate phosphatase [Aestuariimicrobium sp. T2.26MG-19.2B]
MPTLYADLDNTIADRAGAYRAWAVDYLAERGADPSLVDAMVAADRDGLGRKQDTVDDLTRLLDLDPEESEQILDRFRAGIVDRLTLVDGAADALSAIRAAGWRIVIVTNGATAQQTAKIERLHLADLVDGWVISEAAGVSKPDPEIFTRAAAVVGQQIGMDDWMVGDSAESDVAGARAVGMRSIWLTRGRPWPAGLEEPTLAVDTWDEVAAAVLGTTITG